MKHKVLIVDDDPHIRTLLRSFLEKKGYEVTEAATSRIATELLRSSPPDIAVVDYALPDATGLDVLQEVKTFRTKVPVVVLTGHATVELAVHAIKEGAENFVAKPVHLENLAGVLQKALRQGESRLSSSVAMPNVLERHDPFRGNSPLIRHLADQARKVANSTSPVLIEGATGTGKGVLARWLHANGPRAEHPFVDLNCAGLSRDFLETELFGHERGAFTSAVTAKSGLFEIAHNGTMFLDEVGDVDPQVQPKLLKVVEEKRFRRLGDVRDRLVDVRLITATHQDLAALVQQGRFRSDLYFRINTIRLTIPSLKQRTEDIPLLAEHMLRRLTGSTNAYFTKEATRILQEYSWPGNLRELRNVLERAVVLGCGHTITPNHLNFESSPQISPVSNNCGMTLDDLERLHILRVLREEHGRVTIAARRLGIGRATLYKKLKEYKIGLRPLSLPELP